jgi:hypothetical protein
VGSFNLGGVVKAAPGGKAEQFIKPGAGGSRSVLGVLADEKSRILYVCSNDITGFGVPGPGDTKGAWLKTFDLDSGAPKGSFSLQDPKSLCNDIAVGGDGTAYVTDSLTPNVYSLRPGGTALEVWTTDPMLAPAKDGVGLDGIAFGADGNLYVTTYIPAALFKIAVKDGKAGAITALETSRPLDHADAMRTFGDSLLLIEGAGRLDKITINGDEARIETVQDGFAEPVSVTQVGNTGWVAEGKLSYIIGDKGEGSGPIHDHSGHVVEVRPDPRGAVWGAPSAGGRCQFGKAFLGPVRESNSECAPAGPSRRAKHLALTQDFLLPVTGMLGLRPKSDTDQQAWKQGFDCVW